MRVCITGACGFVGRHFVRRLCDDGHDVTGVDDMSEGIPLREWAFPPTREDFKLHLFERDCRDFFRRYPAADFDLIIHCAAVIGSRMRDYHPLAIAENLAIDTAFFQWCTKTKAKKVIYFSSSAAYGGACQTREWNAALPERSLRFDSVTVGIPDGMYGWCKLIGEYLAQLAVKHYGLDVVIYRPQSGYGEDQSLDYPLPRIVQRVVDREDPIVIWGSGEQSRDFIHIDDIVEAVLVTKDKLKPGEVLNLGSGVPTTLKQIAISAGCYGDWNPQIVCDTTKPEGTFARYCDPTKLHTFYKPKVSLAAGIERVYRHLLHKKCLTPVNDPVV